MGGNTHRVKAVRNALRRLDSNMRRYTPERKKMSKALADLEAKRLIELMQSMTK